MITKKTHKVQRDLPLKLEYLRIYHLFCFSYENMAYNLLIFFDIIICRSVKFSFKVNDKVFNTVAI